MSEQKHTPGPWVAVFLHAGGPVMNNGWEIETADYAVAAWITRGAPIRKEADARLIAAAPQLLDACRMFLAASDEDVWQMAVNKAEDAIATAEGES